MQKTNLILLIIGGLVLLVAGYSFGLSLGQKGIEQTETEIALADLIESKVTGRLITTASGEITKVAEGSLTLTNEEDVLTILIREDTIFYLLVAPEEEAETPQPVEQKEIEFGEIKIGDKANISCELKPDAELEGISVTILPLR